MRRHDSVAFMGGAHVFPGGRVDDAERALGDEVAYRLAAIRELFEEAGILLAREAGGRVVDLTSVEQEARYAGYRKALAKGAIGIHEVARRERLELAVDALVWFAQWVTPEIETKRFDTRFFLAAVPEGQEAAHDAEETTHGEWMDPDEAIARCARDEIALPPPTWTTLRRISKFASVDEVMQWGRQQRVVRVQPGVIKDETTTMLTLPGDPTYPALAGFDTPTETRFVLTGGRWRPAAAVPVRTDE